MQQMLKQFGISSEEISAKRVIFELSDARIVIENPKVTAMHVQGQKTYTVLGDERTESAGISSDDIQLVMEQTSATKEEAKKALEENGGDLAKAILKLKK